MPADALDAEDYPLDARDYALGEMEPSGPNMVDDSLINGLVSLLTTVAVPLTFFVVGVLLSLGAKYLGIQRPSSFLILPVSFAPSVLHAQYVRASAFRWLWVEAVLLTFGVLGWLLGRYIVTGPRYRLEQKSLR